MRDNKTDRESQQNLALLVYRRRRLRWLSVSAKTSAAGYRVRVFDVMFYGDAG